MADARRPGERLRSAHPEQRLFKYMLTAGAGMLAASTPAEAGPIYVNPPDQTYSKVNFSLDLNNDGVLDVEFRNQGTFSGPYGGFSLWARGGSGPGILLPGVGAANAAVLSPSAKIRPWGYFASEGLMARVYNNGITHGAAGPWANVTDRFLGLQFKIGQNTHYGWIRMNVSAEWQTLTIAATVKDWAYESTPGVGIHTELIPEPGTLSLLALGAVGLAAWRRRKPRNQ